MYDDQELGAELHRMADADPLGPINSQQLLARGRRGRRRRRIISGSGVIGGVAAVALTASLVPNLGQADTSAADSGKTAKPAAAVAELRPMPGVLKGDAALGIIPTTEALRRCRAQWTVQAGKDPGLVEVLSGQPVMDKNGEPLPGELRWRPGSLLIVGDVAAKLKGYFCVIGGDLLPGTAELAEAAEKSIRTDDTSILRRCSTTAFHDVRGWKVLSKSIQPNALGAAVAVSPSGKFVAHCYLGSAAARKAAVGHGGQTKIIGQWPAPARPDGGYGYAGVKVEDAFQTCGKAGLDCVGWLYHSVRRVPVGVAKLTFESGDGPSISVKVRQGWYALAWATGSKAAQPTQSWVTAYRADGSVIKRVPSGPIKAPR